MLGRCKFPPESIITSRGTKRDVIADLGSHLISAPHQYAVTTRCDDCDDAFIQLPHFLPQQLINVFPVSSPSPGVVGLPRTLSRNHITSTFVLLGCPEHVPNPATRCIVIFVLLGCPDHISNPATRLTTLHRHL